MKSEREDDERFCALCRFASEIATTEDMLCSRKGVVPKEYHCRRFIYDPLKRVPKKPPRLLIPDGLIPDPELSDDDPTENDNMRKDVKANE